MDFDDQLRRYFGTVDIDTLPASTLEAGIEHMKVDLGLQTEPGPRFALWVLLYTLGSAPDLDATFEDPDDREAARDFMDYAESQEGEG